MIPRIERTALEWAYDARYWAPRRMPALQSIAPGVPRDLEDKVVLSPAAQRLLEQAERLARRGDT